MTDTTIEDTDAAEWSSGPMMERVKRFAALSKRKGDVEGELDSIKGQLAALEATLLEDFGTHGVQNLSVDGMTVYLMTQTWAKAPDIDKLGSQLSEADAAFLIQRKVNTQTLSAWVRERKKMGEAIPDSIEVSENMSIRARRK